MSKKEFQDRTAYTTEILEAAEEAIDFLKGNNETPHWRTLKWLLLQAQDTLERLRAGEEISKMSRDMVPVDAILIVLQHFDYQVQEIMDELDDDEFDL